MVAGARRARRRGAFRGSRRDRDADSPETSADASCLDGPEVFAEELALDADLWEAAALVGRRRAGRISSSLSAARAAFNVWISSFSSRSRLSIDSTISWVARMLLMLRTHAALPTAGPGASRRGTAPRREPDRLEPPRICWRVPLCFDIDDTTKTIPARASRTGDCGEEGILGWWWAEHPEGAQRRSSVYPTMEEELQRVCGAAVYDELAAYCRARRNGERCRLTLLPMIL